MGCYDGSSSNSTEINFNNDNLRIEFGGAANNALITTQVFRDPSAWYHIVVAIDTTQATAANRVKMYVNGNQITAFGTANYPAQNAVSQLTSANANNSIGAGWSGFEYFDGYMTDINFIDGQALEPYYFGNNDAYGNWKPIKYTGMYGTNGFYLTFADTTSTTTLGYDTSGNNNNWTTNNISLTAGTTYDAMLDVPTNTSATVANYAVMNPLQKSTGVTASNGNLNLSTGGGSVPAKILSTIGMSSGKYYCEMTLLSGNGNYGLATANTSLGGTTYLGDDAFSWCYAIDGNKYTSGSGAAYGATYTTNDVIGIAFDADAGTLTFYKNGTSQGTAFTGLTSGPYFFAQGASPSTAAVNFGQRPFSYTPPTGYVRLNTFNLPTPTILQGNKYMDANIWTGNGVSQTIVNQAQFKPDLMWTKSRSVSGYYHVLIDSVRGITKALYSNATDAENTLATRITSINNNGYTVGSSGDVNDNAQTFVGWQWQAGQGTNTSNTQGSITSTVSVNTTAGFSIATFNIGASGAKTVGHGLGVKPAMLIFKDRSNANNWLVWHQSYSNQAQGHQVLNATSAVVNDATIWNNTAPTSTVASITSGYGFGANANVVMYAWAEIAGFSKFGSYTGNGSADGPFVYTGFRPKFIMLKRTDTAGESWRILDTSRSQYNALRELLLPDTSGAESSVADWLDIVSNGFKFRVVSSGQNASGGTYIYMAFAENPFKNANAR